MADTAALADLGFLGGSAIAGNLVQQRLLEAAELASRGAQVRNYDASARLHNIQASAAEEDLEADRRANIEYLRRRAALGGSSPTLPPSGQTAASAPPSLAGPLVDMAQIAYDVGSFKRGAALAKSASEILQHERAALNSDANRAKTQLETKLKTIDYGASLLNGVTDQASADMAEAQFQAAVGKSLFEGRPYSPALVARMRQQALSVKEAEELKLSKAKADREAELLPLEKRVKQSQAAANETLASLRKAREAAVGKAGGTEKAIPAVTNSELQAALTRVKSELPDLAQEDLADAAYTTAARAKAAMRKSPGLSQDAAMRQAISQAQKDGDLEVESSFIPFTKDKVRFKGQGKTPEEAIPATTETKYKPDRWYLFPGGVVGRYAGKDKNGEPLIETKE